MAPFSDAGSPKTYNWRGSAVVAQPPQSKRPATSGPRLREALVQAGAPGSARKAVVPLSGELNLGQAVRLHAQVTRVEREFEGTLATARRGTPRGGAPPKPFLQWTPPPHGAVDEELPNGPPEVDPVSMAPFMTDFVREWKLSFSAERASYRSFVLLMEVKLRQGLLVTARLGLPNPYRTALVCECLERLSAVFGRYDACLRVLRGELLRAVYVEYTPAPEGASGGLDLHLSRTPYFARCAELQAQLEELQATFKLYKEQQDENTRQRLAWDKLIHRIERASC